jgi:hypothetical protein
MILPLVLTLLLGLGSLAQADQLADQIDTFKSAQDQNDAYERQEDARWHAEIQAAQRREEERRRAAAAQQAAEARAKDDERLRDKARSQAQEDEDRQLEMEFKRAKLEEVKAMSAAKAARAGDFVEAELAKEEAQTNVIQSGADATRSIAEGAKELQTGIGRGAEAEGKSWFK